MMLRHLPVLLLVVPLAGAILVACEQPPANTPSRADQYIDAGLPRGKATEFGLFRMRGTGWVQDDPAAATGKAIRGATLEFSEHTARVPLRKGISFGYRYWLKFPPDQKQPSFRRLLLHPEMTLPDGSRTTGSERTIRKKSVHGIVTAIDGYSLSEDYELVEGKWVFQLWHQDRLLAEQRFTTYWPEP